MTKNAWDYWRVYKMSQDTRITFRPTKTQADLIAEIMGSGKYLKKSDLIRDAVWKGLMIIKEEIKKNG